MRTHFLKTVQPYFSDVRSRSKSFELRKDDRGFAVGDVLILQEYDPVSGAYTNEQEERVVGYIFRGGLFGLSEGYCILGFQNERG